MRILPLVILMTLLLAPLQAEPEKHHGHPQGHKHNHDFSDAEKWIEKFEDPARDEWQKPDLVVEKLEALCVAPERTLLRSHRHAAQADLRSSYVLTAGRVCRLILCACMLYFSCGLSCKAVTKLTFIVFETRRKN